MGLGRRARALPPLPRAAGHGDGPRARAGVAEPSRLPAATATSCAAASSTQLVADNAVAAGAKLLEGHEAVHPIVERGFVRGATVARPGRLAASTSAPSSRSSPTAPTAASAGRSARPAPGSGRTARRSARTGQSPRHAEPWIESALDVKDRNGNPMPGYGWIFPVGDGTVNIGVGLLSTFRDFKSVNTTHLLDAYAHQIADRWEIDPDQPGVPADERAHPDGRLRRTEGRADVPRRRRRRRQRQPVQRRGHRLRLRDGAHGRRRRSTRRSSTATPRRCSATRSCSTTSTASTSRSPACSPG